MLSTETKRKLPQIAATLGACAGAFSLGTVISWSAPALQQINLQEGQEAQIAALIFIGAAIVPFFLDFTNERIGKKWSMMLLALPAILGWIMVGLGEYSIILFYIGRLMTGFAGGAFVIAAPAYTAETAEISIRGALGSMMQLMITIGILFMYPVGCSVSWQTLTWICVGFPVILLIWMFFMPRSPTYLISKGLIKEGRETLLFLRGSEYNIDQEIQEIERSLEISKSMGSVSYLSLLTEKRYRTPFLLCLVLMFVQQFSGCNFIAAYTVKIFENANSTLDSCLSSSIVMLTQCIGTAVTVLIVDRFGRKILIMVSLAFVSLSLLGLGTYFYLDEHRDLIDEETLSSLGIIPLICLILFSFTFSLGLGPLPWVLNVELFPPEARGKAASVCTCFNWSCSYIVVYFGSILEEAIGSSSCYFLYGGVCILGGIFTLIFIPETKGRTEADMRKHFE
ncbi:facilitated trehalose transporter Tret1 isoform X2 [Eurytemora carolleeae]|uniref:facilitated trehalose transporter Tret1 isoform X1 n=1 Tax=Eurytemora carolleeae TaxID=1294199 RepID=UPI000C76B661|nr:facilitated trehalose transporter Tret1 isoform X1 [Eurytemora carolleeae]XP_023336405.1 facilitated trehalose transporter Tret1 isoform X2 [Eurytemora carolleeae]|eukprot:XP_023336404.1 facilitated trehalose transporter Tret1-like isoform X1 [Eurytemora affinis]